MLSESGPTISLEPANLNQVQSLMMNTNTNIDDHHHHQQQLNHVYYGNQFNSLIQPARAPGGATRQVASRLENEIMGPLVKCNSAPSLPASLLRFYINNRLVSRPFLSYRVCPPPAISSPASPPPPPQPKCWISLIYNSNSSHLLYLHLTLYRNNRPTDPPPAPSGFPPRVFSWVRAG